MNALKIEYDGKSKTVSRADYVRAKTRQLQEFGYPSLIEAETDAQITALLTGKEFGAGLTVIGMMMKGEVIEQIEPQPSTRKSKRAK